MNSDPFGERTDCSLRTRAQVLGGVFEFESNDRALLRLVDEAYAGLPAHSFSYAPPHFRIRLLLSNDDGPPIGDEPPPVRLHSGAGFLCGSLDASNFVVVSPTQGTALVVVSPNLLRHSHTVRYELIEFAVYTLAARAQQLVSMHAACVGRNKQGLLLIGDAGAGKTTLTLHCLLQDMELVAEDAVFIEPETLLATGIGSFLHVREDSLMFLRRSGDEAWVRESPVIRRRSGVEKFAIDLRQTGHHIARAPLPITAVVFLSAQPAGQGRLLEPLETSEFLERLEASQPYAASQSTWAAFRQRIAGRQAFELRRAEHPSEAVHALRQLVE